MSRKFSFVKIKGGQNYHTSSHFHALVQHFLFNHASHTQHNSCTYVQVVDLQMERDSNIYTHSAKLKP